MVKTNEATSPHVVKLIMMGTKPEFQFNRDVM